MKNKYIPIILLFTVLQLGCQKDLPEPEVKFKVIQMSTVHAEHDMPVTIEQKREPFIVKHHVKGASVFVECMVSDISFREKSEKQGKIILYVNGKKKEEITTAAFIIKGLPRGTHQIKLEVVKPNNEPYHLQKEFAISIS